MSLKFWTIISTRFLSRNDHRSSRRGDVELLRALVRDVDEGKLSKAGKLCFGDNGAEGGGVLDVGLRSFSAELEEP